MRVVRVVRVFAYNCRMDYKNPDYRTVLERRREMLARLRTPEGRQKIPALRAYYKENPIQFVQDWAVTLDPRNIERGLPALIPLVPFQRQIDWMKWMLDLWREGKGGLTEKTRDMGCSVCALSLFGALALTHDGFVAGVGSRKEMLVDRIGDPNTLFYKLRLFLQHVPKELRAGWDYGKKDHNAYMNVRIPQTGSVITGEAGDNIGRGGRAAIYLVDEKAFIRNQESIEAALSQTTRCLIDLSSCNGSGNAFAEKRFSGRVPVFTFHWHDDPRKGQEWYEAECARLPPLIVAQEIDIDYNSSKDGVLIPQAWIQAAIGAPTVHGQQVCGFDVADSGMDKNALAHRSGNSLAHIDEWSGKGSDIYESCERVAGLMDVWGCDSVRYDADGLGAGARGDFRVINEKRSTAPIKNSEFRGSGAVIDPDKYAIAPEDKYGNKGRLNKDFFGNRKAQAWWALRSRFEKTYRMKTKGIAAPLDECISLPSDLPNLPKICQELSQPVYKIGPTGHIYVDKAPDATKSPNLADSIMIAFAPEKRVFDLFA